jgi:hypothetical protein
MESRGYKGYDPRQVKRGISLRGSTILDFRQQ